jgi:hypothetical protein
MSKRGTARSGSGLGVMLFRSRQLNSLLRWTSWIHLLGSTVISCSTTALRIARSLTIGGVIITLGVKECCTI